MRGTEESDYIKQLVHAQRACLELFFYDIATSLDANTCFSCDCLDNNSQCTVKEKKVIRVLTRHNQFNNC